MSKCQGLHLLLCTLWYYVRSCEICCHSKVSKHKLYSLLNPLDISKSPLDFHLNGLHNRLNPNLTVNTCNFLVVIDRLSKICHLISFPKRSFCYRHDFPAFLKPKFSAAMDFLLKSSRTEAHNLHLNFGLLFVKD